MKDQPKEKENAVSGSIKAYLLDDVNEKGVECNSESPEPVIVSSQNGQLLSALIDYDSYDSDSDHNNISTQDTHTTSIEMKEPLFGRPMKESNLITNKSETLKNCSNNAMVEVTNNLNGENTDHDNRNFPIVSDYDEMHASETNTEINKVKEESQILDTTNVKLAQFLKKDNLLNVLSAAKDDCDKNFSETKSQVQSLYVSDNRDHQVKVETYRNELSEVVPSNDFDCDNEVENIGKEPVRSGAPEEQDLAVQKEHGTVEHKPGSRGALGEAVSSFAPELYEPYTDTSAVLHEPANVSAPVLHIPAITTAPEVQKVKLNSSRLRPIYFYLTNKEHKFLSIISLDYCTNEEKR